MTRRLVLTGLVVTAIAGGGAAAMLSGQEAKAPDAPLANGVLGEQLTQCVVAVFERSPAVFGKVEPKVSVGEIGDETVRRIYYPKEGALEVGFAAQMLPYDQEPRPGADCAVVLPAEDASLAVISKFREALSDRYGKFEAMEQRERYLSDEWVCLGNDRPLRVIVSDKDKHASAKGSGYRVAVWDSLRERPGC